MLICKSLILAFAAEKHGAFLRPPRVWDKAGRRKNAMGSLSVQPMAEPSEPATHSYGTCRSDMSVGLRSVAFGSASPDLLQEPGAS